MELPEIPQRGRPITAEWGAKVARCIRAFYQRPGGDILSNFGPGGSSMAFNKRFPKFPSGSVIPFQLVDATKSNGSGGYTQQIRIVLGTLQDTSIGGTAWIPSGMTAGDAPANWYIVGVSGQGFAWLVVTYDTTTGIVTSVTLDQGNAVPANTSGTSYLSLGTYDATTSASRVYVTGAIDDQACAPCLTGPNFGPA